MFAMFRYNIKYGKMDSTDEEVEEAARLADIHDTIMGFTDKVGKEVEQESQESSHS